MLQSPEEQLPGSKKYPSFSMEVDDSLNNWYFLCCFRPDLIDFDALDQGDVAGNMANAFDVAEKELGVPNLLDIEGEIYSLKSRFT